VETLVGSRAELLVRGQAASFLAFERQMEVAKLPSPYFAMSKLFTGVQYCRGTDRKGVEPARTPFEFATGLNPCLVARTTCGLEAKRAYSYNRGARTG